MTHITKTKRKVYFISDGTGITAESLGQSLLTQFESIEFDTLTLPYINTLKKAHEVIEKIQADSTHRPLVFSTLVDAELRQLFQSAPIVCFDLFDSFIAPLEKELEIESSHSIGKTHGVNIENYNNYMLRMNAVNYALANDDGANIHDYDEADIILVGVSRCGKTPTCLYLALQFGIYAANYPMTEDEESMHSLPSVLKPLKSKLFGLIIDPMQLHKIRQERRPNSQYSSLQQCRYEAQGVQAMFRKERIHHINTTAKSIEEIATQIMSNCNLKRRLI